MAEKGSIKFFFHTWWKWLTPSVLLTMLVAGTLVFQTFTVTTASASPALATATACQASYSAAGEPIGFIADITITNTSVKTLHHWKVQVIYPDTPVLLSGWNGIVSQQGNQIIIKNTKTNGVVAPGASINPGFDTSWNNDTTTPSSIKLNGATCTLTIV